MAKKYKKCQSCGTSIKEIEKRGTEADQTKSKKYCYHCYEHGEFLQDITVDEMKENFYVFLTVDREVMKWMAKLRVRNIHKLERWNDKKRGL